MAKVLTVTYNITDCAGCPYIDFEHMGIDDPVCRAQFVSDMPEPVLLMNDIDDSIHEFCPIPNPEI